MSEAGEGGVLLLSTAPGAHELMLRTFRDRGMPVAVSGDGERTLAHLRHHPAIVLLDLSHGPGLNGEALEAVKRLKERTMVLGIHEGDLDRFAKQFDALVVNAYCHARNWRTIVDLAAAKLKISA